MSELVANGGVAMHNACGKAQQPEAASAASDARRAALVERRMLTDIEVAARLGVSPFTVRSWRRKGVGPRFLKMGRAVRYRPEDVDEYVRQALIEPQTR
jgi:excisionase family DNA binding protein